MQNKSCSAIAAAPKECATAMTDEPDAWHMTINGNKTANVARSIEEKKEMEIISKIASPNGKIEWIEYFTAPQQPVAAIEPTLLNADDCAKRIRLLCKMLGLEGAIPAIDAQLFECQFSVFGMMRAKLEELLASQPSASTTVMPDEVTPNIKDGSDRTTSGSIGQP